MKGLDASSNGRSGSLAPFMELERPTSCSTRPINELSPVVAGNRQLLLILGFCAETTMLYDVAYSFHALLRSKEEFFELNVKPASCAACTTEQTPRA